jgi:hypothetical protein
MTTKLCQFKKEAMGEKSKNPGIYPCDDKTLFKRHKVGARLRLKANPIFLG